FLDCCMFSSYDVLYFSLLPRIDCYCLIFFFFLMIRRPPRSTLFPYTTLSDLPTRDFVVLTSFLRTGSSPPPVRPETPSRELPGRDRKSTRLNSSHLVISYAVFCLKKKKKKKKHTIITSSSSNEQELN